MSSSLITTFRTDPVPQVPVLDHVRCGVLAHNMWGEHRIPHDSHSQVSHQDHSDVSCHDDSDEDEDIGDDDDDCL